MTAMPLTETGVRAVKRALAGRFPQFKSAHLSEALAAASGFNSNAALRASLLTSDQLDPARILLEDRALIDRLAALSGDKAADIDLRFSFDRLSFEPGTGIIATTTRRTAKVDYGTSRRRRAWRNAMVLAINAGLQQKLFSVLPGDNRWSPGEDDHGNRRSHVFTFTAGAIPAVASVHDAGYEELSIHVALWPTEEGGRWVRTTNGGFLAGACFATGWLERREGAWLQVPSTVARGWSFACRKQRLDEVADLDVRPQGFADRGRFQL